MNAAPHVAEWVETITVLAVGTSSIVGLAAVAAAWLRSAAAQRTVWQAATLGVLALVACELCGASGAAVATVGGWLRGDDLAADAPLPRGKAGPPAFAPLPPLAGPPGMPDAIDRAARTLERIEAFAGDGELADAAAPPDARSQVDALLGELAALEAELAAAEARVAGRRAAPIVPPSTPRGGVARAGTWWPGAVWLSGTIALACWSAMRRAAWRMRARGRRLPDDGPPASRLRRVAERLGYRRRIRLVEIEGLAGPVAYGLWRPTIGLPPTFTLEFNAGQQEAMLAHEVAHLAGRDPFWQALAGAACALLWWQPLVWWQRRQLRAANEAMADEASLVVADGPSVLADCLVRLGRRLARSRSAGPIGIEGGGFRSGLGRRVVRLLNLPRGGWRPERAARAAAVKTLATAALLVVVLLTTAWARRPAPSGETNMSTFGTSWRKSLGAAALLAAWGPATPAPAQEGQPEPAAVEREDGVRENADRESQPPVETLLDRIKILEAELTAARHEARALMEASEAQRLAAEQQRGAAEQTLRAVERMERRALDGEASQRRVTAQRFRQSMEQRIQSYEARLARAVETGDQETAAQLERQLLTLRSVLSSRHEQEPLEGERLAQAATAQRGAAEEQRAVATRKYRQDAEEHIGNLEKQLAEAIEAGNKEAAAKIETQLQAFREKLKNLPDQGEPGPDPQFREKLEEARREIEKLRAAGQVEEAEALERKVREHLSSPQRGEEKRPDHRQDEMARLKQQVAELRERGEHDAAEKLERHLMQLAEGGQPDKPRDEGEKRPDPRQEEMARLKQQLAELRERGEHEAAEKLEQHLRAMAEGPQPDKPREEGGEREELRRRLKHLTAAAENLRAGGMPDLAERVHRQAEALHRELGEGGDRPRGERRPEGDRRPEEGRRSEDRRRPEDGQRPEDGRRPRPDEARPGGDRRPAEEGDRPRGELRGFGGQGVQERFAAERELVDVIRALRGEVQELREQMNDLRERVGHEEEEVDGHDDDAEEMEEESEGHDDDNEHEREDDDAGDDEDDVGDGEGEGDDDAGDDEEEEGEEEGDDEVTADEPSEDEESGEEAEDSDEPSEASAEAGEQALFFRLFGGGQQRGDDEAGSTADTSDGRVPVPVP